MNRIKGRNFTMTNLIGDRAQVRLIASLRTYQCNECQRNDPYETNPTQRSQRNDANETFWVGLYRRPSTKVAPS